MTDYAAPASGAVDQAAPAPAAPSGPQTMAPPGFPAVEDTPFLNDPDTQPNVMPGFLEQDQTASASRDLQIIQTYLPDMRQQAAFDDAPPTFKAFVRWLEQQ